MRAYSSFSEKGYLTSFTRKGKESRRSWVGLSISLRTSLKFMRSGKISSYVLPSFPTVRRELGTYQDFGKNTVFLVSQSRLTNHLIYLRWAIFGKTSIAFTAPGWKKYHLTYNCQTEILYDETIAHTLYWVSPKNSTGNKLIGARSDSAYHTPNPYAWVPARRYHGDRLIPILHWMLMHLSLLVS